MAFIFETLLIDIGVLVVCLLAVTYAYFRHSYKYWKKRNVPYLEPNFPIGHFADNVFLRKSLGEVYKDIYRKLEGEKYGGTYMFTNPGFVFRDPDLIKSALVKDFSSFHDRGFYVNEEIDPLIANLFFLPGTRWKNLRVKLTPTFTSGKMKMMFQTLVDCGIELGSTLQEIASKGEVIEIKDYLARYSTDIISSCAFGIESNSLKNPDAEFRQWGRKFFTQSIKKNSIRLFSTLAPTVLKLFKTNRIDTDVSKYFLDMVRETIEYREKNSVKRNDFMQLLIQLKNKGHLDADDDIVQENDKKEAEVSPSSNYLSVNNIAAQAFVFFVAGFETSSTTMTFCLYELSKYPDIQELVRKEILTVLNKHGGNITYEAIMEMNYLDNVVSETLRKYPPVPLLNRAVTKEYKVPGTDIILEKGMPTVIPVLGLHNDPKFYPDPERFDPERFSEKEKAKRHPYVYLPFGEGPRICIGMRFGLMQTKVGLVSLLSKYRFSLSAKTPVPLAMDKKSMILSPVGGMWLQLNKCS